MKIQGIAILATLLVTAPAALGGDAGPGKPANPASSQDSLWSHIHSASDLGPLRHLSTAWDASVPGGALKLVSTGAERYDWATVPTPQQGWDLARRASVEAEITNRGKRPVEAMLWVVPDRGWDAVPDAARLAPGESRRFACRLRSAFPDGTPKLDPGRVKQVQVMLVKAARDAALEVRGLAATGEEPLWTRPPGRLEVPDVKDGLPAAGRRVRYRLAGDDEPAIYCIVELPSDWTPGRKFPVIVEYPGNIFYTTGCYSTGLPDQCVIGHGITRGRGAICVGLPFVDHAAGIVVENGWGNADDTADYAVRAVEEICRKFGGDRQNVLLTGFSRGAIACGYIGLRNDRIAQLWKGFHACQHYDGDGWNGATMEGALQRARRFTGQAVFQTDNSQETFQPIMDAMKTRATFVRSGLGAHATAMFLDDRPSTQQLRRWFWNLVGEPTP